MYSKEEIIKMRRFIADMPEEEAENLPFGHQSELFKLGEAIMAKFERTAASNLFKLKSGRAV